MAANVGSDVCIEPSTETKEKKIYDTIIVGGGCAGFSCGIYTTRNLRSHILFEGSLGGQLATTDIVENYPGRKMVDGFELVKDMKEQAVEQGCNVVSDKVTNLELEENLFKVKTETGGEYLSRTVVLATGAQAKRLHVFGEDKFWNRGISACAVCDSSLPRFRQQPIAVIGGGDSACTESEHLAKYGSHIFLIHRSEKFRASSTMLERVKKNSKITILTNYVVESCEGDESEDGDGLTAINLVGTKTGEKKKLEVRGLFYAIGHIPAVELILESKTLKNKVELDEYNYVKSGLVLGTSDKSAGITATSVPGLYVAGDIGDRVYRQAGFAAGLGIAAALDVDRYLSEHSE